MNSTKYISDKKRTFMGLLVLLVPILACNNNDNDTSSDARYTVSFTTDWSAENFSTNFPANRHFSGLIGATHDSGVEFWTNGGEASAGIQIMAETGSKSPLTTEINDAINNGSAEFLLSGGGISASSNGVTLEFSIGVNKPKVTLVSMVAPSPDWFVGVNGLDLYDNGEWISELQVDLAVYDAGTDSGLRFSSNNSVTVPQQPIGLLTSESDDTDFLNGIHRTSQRVIGTFIFTRIQ